MSGTRFNCIFLCPVVDRPNLLGRVFYDPTKISDNDALAQAWIRHDVDKHFGSINIDWKEKGGKLQGPGISYTEPGIGMIAEGAACGLKTGVKANVNSSWGTFVSLITVGFVEPGDFWVPTDEDLANGYELSKAVSRISKEFLAGVMTGGLSKVSLAGKAKWVGKAAFYADLAQSTHTASKGAADAADNGLTLQNGTMIASGYLGIGAQWLSKLGPNCFVAGTKVVMATAPAETFAMLESPDDIEEPAYRDWITVTAMTCLPLALVTVGLSRKKRRREKGTSAASTTEPGEWEAFQTPLAEPDEHDDSLEMEDREQASCAGAFEHADCVAIPSEASSLDQTDGGRSTIATRSRLSRKSLGGGINLASLALAILLAGLACWGVFFDHTPPVSIPAGSVAVADARPQYVTKSIEQIQLGDRVLGTNPEVSNAERTQPDPDPATWRQVALEMTKEDGRLAHIKLLRPLDWLQQHRAQIGATINLDMPEMGAKGPATVLSIAPSPPILPGAGRVVTGTFTHETANNLLDVYVAGLDEPIGTTTNHPFWSEDRQTFVHAGWLNVGERVRTGSGEQSRVTALNRKPGTATVYTLEVDVEHVYLVSDLAVLVHNTTPQVPKGNVKYHYTDAPEESFKKGFWSHSSATDNPNLSPKEAVEQLGVKRPPDKIIPVRDNGNFVPNSPPIVEPHPLGPGGGADFINPNKIPGHDVLPAIPIPPKAS